MSKTTPPKWILKKNDNGHGYPINIILKLITPGNMDSVEKGDIEDTLAWLAKNYTFYKRKQWDALPILKAAGIAINSMKNRKMKYKKNTLIKAVEKVLKPKNHVHRWKSEELSEEVEQQGRRHTHDTDDDNLDIGTATGEEDKHTHPVIDKTTGMQLGFTSGPIVNVAKTIFIEEDVPESRRMLSAALGYRVVKADYEEEEDPEAIAKLEKCLKNVPKETKIAKADKEKRLFYAIVLEPEEIDSQKDIISQDETQAAAHDYLTTSRVVGLQHRAKTPFQVVESYISPINMTFKGGPFGDQKVKKGTWIIVIHVTDDEVWQMILDKKITGVSIGATGVRVAQG